MLGDVSRSVLPLIAMLDDVPLVKLHVAVADEDGLRGCGVPLSKDTVETICDEAIEIARESPLIKLNAGTVEGLPIEHIIAAFVIYTMEEPFPFYQLVTKTLNESGVRSKEKLSHQLKYLKLLEKGFEIFAKVNAYWYQGVVIRGVNLDKYPSFRSKYDDYKNAYALGTKVTFAAPTSTTTSDDIASKFRPPNGGIQFIFQGEQSDRGPGGLMLKVIIELLRPQNC